MTIKDLLEQEKTCRKSNKWLVFSGPIINDNGIETQVQIKSFGFYNQILRLNGSQVNHCAGHTIDRVGAMHKYITDTINGK